MALEKIFYKNIEFTGLITNLYPYEIILPGNYFVTYSSFTGNIDFKTRTDINLEEIKLGSEIICPVDNCFLNAIISINPILFEVKSNCGKHERKLEIISPLHPEGVFICGGIGRRNDRMQKDLIDSVKNGYPFGSLVMFNYERYSRKLKKLNTG